MPDFHWRLAALVSQLDDDSLLARPLLLPGVSSYALNARQLKTLLVRRVGDVIKQLPPGDLYRYIPASAPQVRTLSLEVPPRRDDVLCRSAVELALQYVVWQHVDALVAYVPALDVAVHADDERQLADLLPPQLQSALSRRRAPGSLRELTALARFRELRLRPLRLKTRLPTLKEAAKQREAEFAAEKSLLKEIASNLAVETASPVHERDADVGRLAELLTRRSPRSVLLVGRSGVGKTAIVQHLARHAASHGMDQTLFWSTSGSRIVAGMTGFGMWQERCEKLVREASKANAILHLGNLVELIEVGKGGGNNQGVAAVLRPHLDRGALLAIVECTPDQIAVIEREDPQLLETFVQFELEPSSPEQTRAILRAVALERLAGPRLTDDALAALDRLHRRFATYSASPGRQLRFLRNLLDDQRQARSSEISPQTVTASFSRETGLPHFMLDDAVPLDLAATRRWFTDRVIGQPDAVAQVVELLASVKAELARGGKPLASLLFIGPTGVGKTELAKTLVEFLYQDRGRMIRFDMSEYSHPAAVERLIGGAYAAQGLLTQKVRDQPFTVVLLDEFEKAHSLLFDVLLQVLGEGRLTDGLGRVTDFTNAVVIMTSNLGADTFRGAPGFVGQVSASPQAQRHFEREVQKFLRPEMFNRLDRIVPFAPLDQATIAGIARRELAQFAARDGLRFRGVELAIDENVVEQLAATGFDVRYGARPLKRAIEQQLVAPLAAGLNRYSGQQRLDCRAQVFAGEVQAEIVARPGSAPSEPAVSAADAIHSVVALRRHTQALLQSGILTRLRNEIERLRQEERSRARRRKKLGVPPLYAFSPEQARLLGQEKILQRADALAGDVMALEDDALQRLYASQPVDAATIDELRVQLDRRFRELLFDLPQIDGSRRTGLTIAAFGESLPAVVELMRAYREVSAAAGDTCRWYWLKMYRAEHDGTLATAGRPFRPPPGPRPIARLVGRRAQDEAIALKVIDVFNSQVPWDEPPADCIGIAVVVTGERSAALLEAESGRHEFIRFDGTRHEVFVETAGDRLLAYDPPADVGRRGSFSNIRQRRTYDLRKEECADALLRRTLPLRGRRIDLVVVQAADEFLTARLWELIEAWS